MNVANKNSAFRELTPAEISAVAGGFDEFNNIDPADFDPYGMSYITGLHVETVGFDMDGSWTDWLPDWLKDYFQDPPQENDIVITAHVLNGVDLGNGHELVTFNDGVRSLYIDGHWFANVQLTDVKITNGSTSVGLTLNSNGSSFTYSSGDSAVYTFAIVPGR